MADLHGVLLPLTAFAVGKTAPAMLGDYQDSHYPPVFEFVCLSNSVPEKDIKRFRVRPTGPNGSGPYFNARISGFHGVTAAALMRPNNWVNSPYYPTIHNANYTMDDHDNRGGYEHRLVYRFYTNGYTACYYQIEATADPLASGRAYFRSWTVADQSIPSTANRRDIRGWFYTISNSLVHLSTVEQIKSQFDWFVWDVLSSARTHNVDPILKTEVYTAEVGRGRPLSLTVQDFSYLYSEWTAFEWWSITGELEGKYRALAGEALYNAAANLPNAACNSIANVLEIAGSIKDALSGDLSKLIPSNPKEAWLFYRYQYSTTKLDIGEYRDLTERLLTLASLPVIRCDGRSTNGGISCHCEIHVDPTFLIPDSTKRWLKTYGFQLSWYNIWDMIPYSFVVDWFLNIGSFLETMEREQWIYSLPIRSAWTSFTTNGPGAQITHFRIPGYYRANCPFLDYRQRSASGKTVAKRILDSIALFL